MSTSSDGVDSRATADEVAELKRLAAGIIRSQGNRFIKELLRSNDITIGATKDDFEANLKAAIEAGELRLGDVEAWLGDVEGWGNQHVYLYRLSPTLDRQLTPAAVRERATDAGMEDLWEAPTVLAFPDHPQLTSISADDGALRLVWQEASPAWTRVEDRDYREEEGLDTYEYRAWRIVERRAVTRFEAHREVGLAGLFIPTPIRSDEHQAMVAEAKRAIGLLLDLPLLERHQVDVSTVARNMDQRNVPDGRAEPPRVKVQRSRLSSGGAYVEFAARSKGDAYWQEDAIRGVRRSVRDPQLVEFHGSGGVFWFQQGPGPDDLARELRAQLYGMTTGCGCGPR